MAMLMKGIWCPSCDEADLQASGLHNKGFNDWITIDGKASPTGDQSFLWEEGRYHLYVSLACPFAHRTLLMRSILGLSDAVSVSIVAPKRKEDGWHFDQSGEYVDSIMEKQLLREIYLEDSPSYSGRVSVPVLWDKKQKKIVSNDSGDILRMLDQISNESPLFSSKELLKEIDNLNEFIQTNINFGVYQCGFSNGQEAYREGFAALFDALDHLEKLLQNQRYLLGNQITECDWRLFTTLIRFDSVYYVHFKTNKKRIEDYPNLSNYLRDLYQYPGVEETVDMEHIKVHYYYSHNFINPSQIVPLGPELNLDRPHNRERLVSQ